VRSRAQQCALYRERERGKFYFLSGERRNLIEREWERKKMPRSSTLVKLFALADFYYRRLKTIFRDVEIGIKFGFC